MLNVARLQVLQAVAETGSLTAAARKLAYTPSAVSQQIALLQRETGARLVERHRRGVHLTEAGRELARHAAAVLAGLVAAEAAVAAVERGHGGRLRLGSFPTANATLMPRAVGAFAAARPGVALELVELDGDEGVGEVAAHRLDIALTYEFPMVPLALPDGVRTVALCTDALHIMLPSAHPLAGRTPLRLADLGAERWIQGVRHGSTLAVLPQSARAAGFEAEIVFRTDDQLAVRGLVAAGIGVALTSSMALTLVADGVVVRPLDEPTLTRRVLAALPATPLASAQHMADTLVRTGAELAGISACAPPAPAHPASRS